MDGETTLAALQADYQTLSNETDLFRTVSLWVHLLLSAENRIAAGPGLITLENKIAAEIAAAPAGPETDDAQTYLNDMKLAVTAGESLVSGVPAMLLAITPSELADGSAKATLASVTSTMFGASWDFDLAHWAANWAEHELKEANATPKPSATPKATPVATATPV